MKLVQLLSPSQILLDLQAVERWPAIIELVDALVAPGNLPAELRDEVLAALKTREDLVSTGIGSGVAIPHAFSDQVDHVVAVVGRSLAGIDFEALDEALVNFIILFIVPRENYQLHLHTLSAIAKMFTNSEIRRRLTAAQSQAEIMTILDAKPAPAAPALGNT
jgi:mannitol/fructose-specific phosphotransferase system IIA component (Ntr-type)